MSLIDVTRKGNSKFVEAVLTLVTGQALGQALGLVTTPIVSRLYDTTAYGDYAIVVSTATIICTVSQAGLASAIMMPDSKAEAKALFNVASVFQLTITTAVSVFLALFWDALPLSQLSMPSFEGVLLIWIYSVLTNFSNLLRIYMNRLKQYRSLFWNSLISALATLLITIPLGLINAGFIGFMIAACASTLICIIQMAFRDNPFHRVSVVQVVNVLKEYKRFVVLQLPANLIRTLTQQIPNQLLGAAYGSSALGGFSMSNKVLGIPSRLVASPVNTVYFQTAVDRRKKGVSLAPFTLKMIKWMMIAWSPIIIVLIAVGEPLFGFVLGEQWQEAGTISALLSLWYALSFCGTCVSYCRVALDRQGVNLAVSIVSLVIVTVCLALGLLLFDNVVQTLACFAVGACLVQIVDMLINFTCMGQGSIRYLAFMVGYMVVVGGIGMALRSVFSA